MDERVLTILEYDRVIAMLAAQAVSEMGKHEAAKLQPDPVYARVEISLEQTAQAESALQRLGKNPVDAFPDVRAALKKAPVTVSLGQKELLLVSRALRAIRMCRESLDKNEIGAHLRRLAGMLFTGRYAEEEIQRCILSEDEMADGASPALSRIRSQIRACHTRVRDKLNSLLHSSSFKLYLQDPIITVRNGRYVLPVKQEHRGQVPGLLHDQSGSGATLFIEPMAVVEIGNEMKKLESDEQDEIERILATLTQLVAPDAAAYATSLEMLAQIDVLFAKASLARQMRAIRPRLNERGYIRVMAGRHPLIDPDKVVPIDVWLGADFTTLIVTGPNTGGKTVTLKTVGLFTAMAQAGLFLPAAQGVEMAVFAHIFADIGDEQSIEQSLSTFSSHMGNIVRLLEHADDQSLVLLDELGSGTDPIEGAALAMAILQELHRRRCIVLATTHYSELKAFALTREGMENASMEFDLATLRPTYRVFVGIPGKSNAFEISRKLGLRDDLIASAQQFLDHEDIRFEDVISSAESQRRIAEEERKLAEAAREELYKLREQTEIERTKLEQQRDRQVHKAQAEARKVVADAKAEAERVIKELRRALKEAGNSESARGRAIQEARDAIRQQESQHAAPQAVNPAQNEAPPKAVKPGDDVYVVSLDTYATVLKSADSRGDVQIQAGILKLNAKLSDLRLRSANRKEKKAIVRAELAAKQVSLEIDLRGELLDDALLELDRYLDDATLAGLREVTVIHGKGTGALRSGIQDRLRGDVRVKSYRSGRYGEGEAGVTIVTLH